MSTSPFQDSEGFYTMVKEEERPPRFPNPSNCIEFEVIGETGRLLGIVAEIKYTVYGKTSGGFLHTTHTSVFVDDEKGQRVYFFNQIGRWRSALVPIPKIDFP
jgi:hypothetical protein